ncbi:MAG: methyltransferase domain-containing protein, partial [Actinoallomurus sp.]
MTISANYRSFMVKALEAAGEIRSSEWSQVVERVPRELFVGDRFLRAIDTNGPRWQEVSRSSLPIEEWLGLIYSDQTLVTQVGGAAGELVGPPTSSSTMPGLVVRMLEDSGIRDGHRVLEIGTGTGYSTALLSERLGAERVTSIEVDPGVAGRARQALEAAGYTPTLVNGNGLDGYPTGLPYDRIIATCSVKAVPPAWLRQVRAGGNILTTLFGSLNAYGYVRLVVDDDGSARGRFLPGTVSFMPARAHVPEPWTSLPKQEGRSRRTTVRP